MWRKPEVFIENATLLGQTSQAIGITVESDSGKIAFASAAGTFSPLILKRAYFELIERTSILEAQESSQIFFNEDLSAPWSYSRSNGVATHVDINEAKHSATFEILERDAILRSWYSKTRPLQVTFSELGMEPPDPSHEVDIRIVRFPQTCIVLGVFGFPKKDKLPLFFGFAAGNNLKEVFQHAWDEAMQRLIFTADGPFPNALPQCQSTPDYHLDYYLYPPSSQLIRDWLEGPKREGITAGPPRFDKKPSQFSFLDLTPQHLKNRLWVLKGCSEEHLPLVFGNWTPPLKEYKAIDIIPHPIA
jgi:hypothetical protein